MKTILFLVLLLQVLIIENIGAQEETFTIGGIMGLNFAFLPYEHLNINGEDQRTYNGLNTGIFCNAFINKYFSIKTEILYSSNGSYIYPESFPKLRYGKSVLRHVEVPFHIDFYVNSFKSTSFLPDWSIEAGGAYVRMFNYYVEDIEENNVTQQIEYSYKRALLLQTGTTIFFSRHFGGNLRFSFPLYPFKNELSLTTAIRLIYRI